MKQENNSKTNDMTNTELIKELQKYPEGTNVFIVSGDTVDDVTDCVANIVADVYTTNVTAADGSEQVGIVMEY